ncbi:MAG: hypothetical protein LBS92_04520 [Candidatus Methanoplasma sp.]|jgi:hypothetical protein|nr:hypothetical protein [Candidatus Methanoplasma sp.]
MPRSSSFKGMSQSQPGLEKQDRPSEKEKPLKAKPKVPAVKNPFKQAEGAAQGKKKPQTDNPQTSQGRTDKEPECVPARSANPYDRPKGPAPSPVPAPKTQAPAGRRKAALKINAIVRNGGTDRAAGKPIKFFRERMSRVLGISVGAIFLVSAALTAMIIATGHRLDLGNVLEGVMVCVLALLFGVVIMDSIVAYSNEAKRKSDEKKAIIRRNKIIQPILDMYLVRKNMMITPRERSVSKFKIDATFTVKDLKDMFDPSELVSDTGKSKIEMYAFYQKELKNKLTSLVEDVEFQYYDDLCNAAMRYINTTAYGESAVEAVMGYKDAMTGTRSMKSIVLNALRDSPDERNFVAATPMMKNIYLLYDTVDEQEKAIADYLRLVNEIISEEPKDRSKFKDTDYE